MPPLERQARRHNTRAAWLSAFWSGLCVVSLVSCVGAQGQLPPLDDTPELLDPLPAGAESLEGVNPESPASAVDGEKQPINRPEGPIRQGSTSAIDTPSRSEVAPQASAAVSNYLALTDEVGETGGVTVDAMAEVVTPQWLAVEQRGFADYRERRIKTLGHTDFFALSVQSVRWSSQEMWEVAVFACIDSRRVWVVPADSPATPDGLVEWLVSTSSSDGDTVPGLSEADGAEEPTDSSTDSSTHSSTDSSTDSPSEADVALWQEFIDDTNPDAGPLEPVLLWLVGSHLDQLKVDATETWRGYHPCGTDNPLP